MGCRSPFSPPCPRGTHVPPAAPDQWVKAALQVVSAQAELLHCSRAGPYLPTGFLPSKRAFMEEEGRGRKKTREAETGREKENSKLKTEGEFSLEEASRCRKVAARQALGVTEPQRFTSNKQPLPWPNIHTPEPT